MTPWPATRHAPARIVLALRRSPDWDALAADHARGLTVVPARYVPADRIPAFPTHIADCIARWNTVFRVDFFTCRAELRRIARATLDGVRDALVLTRDDLPQSLPAGRYRLFFLDDDDWFAPDTCARLACVGAEDVAVFPLLRLDVPVFTFVRESARSGPVIGVPGRFSNRYQTNNYALHPRVCTSAALPMMEDHITASDFADRCGLHDAYHDVMVSVTNKTPAAASVVSRIVEDEEAFRGHVAAFVAALRGLSLPAHAAWIAKPIRQTAALFERALGQAEAD
jgi:hypothetical protein